MTAPGDPILVSSHLDLFENKPIFRSFQKTRVIDIFPNEGWLTSSVISFDVPRYEELMYKSDSFTIEAEWQMANGDGSEIDDNQQTYAPVCGIGICAFEYCSTEVGQTLISGENRFENYRYYLEHLLGASSQSKATWLEQRLIWAEDSAALFNDTAKDSKNTGFLRRYAIFSGGSKVKTYAKLPFPLAQTRKMLIPGIQLKFSLKRASNKFLIITNSPAKNMELKLVSIKLRAKTRALEVGLYAKLVEELSRNQARYGFIRSSIWSSQLTQESLTHRLTLFKEFAPETIYIFFVNVDSYLGSYSTNPFNFQTPKIASAYVIVEGEKFPNFPYAESYWGPDPNKSQARWPYLELFRILQQDEGLDCGVSFNQWLNGMFVLAFQLSENLPSTAYVSERRKGDTVLTLEFESIPDKPLMMMAVAQFQSSIFVTNTSGVLKTFVV